MYGMHTIRYIGMKSGWARSWFAQKKFSVSDRISPVKITATANIPADAQGGGRFKTTAVIVMELPSISMGKVSKSGSWADIHYTTDGSEPTAKSPVYDQPIQWSTLGKTMFRAVSYSRIVDEMLPSTETQELVEILGVPSSPSLLDPSVRPIFTRKAFPAAMGGCTGEPEYSVSHATLVLNM